MPEMRFHDLRHTYALDSTQSGDDIKTILENLGHHSESFTLDVYRHVSERMRRDNAERMEQFIKGISEKKRTFFGVQFISVYGLLSGGEGGIPTANTSVCFQAASLAFIRHWRRQAQVRILRLTVKQKSTRKGHFFILAEKEGFEPSHRLPQPTPLAGEPLQPYLGTSPYKT